MSEPLVVFICLAGVLMFWGVGVHNRLIRLRSAVVLAHAHMDTQLKRRYDLAPRWVEAALAYFSDALAMIESTSAASTQAKAAADALRSAPTSAAALRALALADSVLKNALDASQEHLNADTLHAAYVAVDQSLRDCTADWDATSSALGFARQAYNKAVLAYNGAIVQFPALLLAKATGQKPAGLWAD